MDGRWQLVAGCFSRNPSTNKKTGAAWNVNQKRIYSSADELIAMEKNTLDAIAILTPTNSHIEWVIKALGNGYSVICEKALATSLLEAKDILRACEGSGSLIAITYNYSGYPMVRELRQIVEEGDLGKINKIQIEMPQEAFLRESKTGERCTPQAWRLRDENIPVISLDLGVHLHHLVYFLTGEVPLKVVGDTSSDGWFTDVVDDVSCLVKYSNKLRCQMWYSKSALGNRNGLKVRLFGDKGSATWHQANPEELQLNYADGQRTILERGGTCRVAEELRYNRFKAGHPAGFIEAFANLYADIADKRIAQIDNAAVEENKRFVYGAEHAVEGLSLFEALHRSIQSERWESLEH